MNENSWYPEEREDVSQRTTSPQEQQQAAALDPLSWQQHNDNASSPHIWSPSHSQQESSFYGDSSLHRSINDSFENDVVTSMASISFSQPPQQYRSSSLQAAAAHGVPASSSSLASSSTLPGLTGLSSGSMSGVDSRRVPQSSLQSAAAAHVGPPPGFISPIQSRTTRSSSNCSSSSYSQQQQCNDSRRKSRRGKSGDSSQHSGYSSHGSTRGGSSFPPQQQRSNDSYSTTATSEALRALMNPPAYYSSSSISTLEPTTIHDRPILPKPSSMEDYLYDDTEDEDDISFEESGILPPSSSTVCKDASPKTKKHDWLLRMNRKLQEVPVGELDPATVPLSAVMNAWAKTKSAQGASMVYLQ